MELSDGVGSPVESPHLVVVAWVKLTHSKDESVAADVLSRLDGSAGSHGGSKVELGTISKGVSY